jgi:hypothetical protein
LMPPPVLVITPPWIVRLLKVTVPAVTLNTRLLPWASMKVSLALLPSKIKL